MFGYLEEFLLAKRAIFVNNLDRNEKTIADLGYRYDPHFQTPFDGDGGQFRSLEIQKRIRSRHETINARMKAFKVLDREFRHELSFHIEFFHAVANIVQLNLKNVEPLWEV